MKDPRRDYDAALADFSQPHNRWNSIGRLTFWGKAAGLTAEDIVADARAAGVKDRDADIRRGWNFAKPKECYRHYGWRRYLPRTKPKTPPKGLQLYVSDMVVDGGGEATAADLRALSPHPIPTDGMEQTAAFLRSLWNGGDKLYIFRNDMPTAGKPEQNLMPCREWLNRIERGETMYGDLIVPNPLTGEEGETTDGKKSYISQSCLARFPFIIVEFDSMPLKPQAAFWRGLLTKSPLAPNVAAITFSGGKSLHGLIHIGCDTLAEWQTVRDKLHGLFAADHDPAFRADEQAMRPRTGTRLPGVRRMGDMAKGAGKLQSLLYLNPAAVHPCA